MIAIFGGSGGVGQLLDLEHEEVVRLSSEDVDITDAIAVIDWLDEFRPSTVINAAVCNVDGPVAKNWNLYANAVGIDGLHNVLRGCLPYMQRQKHGNVIHLSSVLSRQAVPSTGVYSASKAYAEQLIRVAAVENARYGVRLNCIRMGYFGVGLNDTISEERQAAILKSIPLRRYGKGSELTSAVDFLLTNEYVTGSCLDITGGL